VKKTLISLAILSSLSTTVFADENATSFAEAFSQGTAKVSMRFRYENVDQDGFADSAELPSARFRFNFKTKQVNNFGAFFELDHLTELWNTDYNSLRNGNTTYPVIADPLYTDLNQAYISYNGFDNTTIKYGRQRINLDNQRFIGGVGWRMNEQTYDGVTIVNNGIEDTTIVFASLYNVNTILNTNASNGQHTIINVAYDGIEALKVTGYSYLLADISDTYGIRFKGTSKIDTMKLGYQVEFASQKTDNAAASKSNYYLVETSLGNKSFTGEVGYEVHTAANGVAFQTPLGTNHAFNGWADKFLGIQGDGLEDLYLGAIIPVSDLKVKAYIHDFSAENSGRKFGTEYDFAVVKKIDDNYSLLFKYASYSADNFSANTDKLWIQLTANY
jgi:hypothetical protein